VVTGPVDTIATVDTTVPHQTLIGFGAAVAFYADYLSGRTDDIFDVLFPDLGLDILRIGNWYQNQKDQATNTTPLADDAVAALVQKATTALGHPPTLLMSGWSPPAYLKSNGALQSSAGTLVQVSGAYDYADFADWWVRSLNAYAAAGVAPDYISIQNEPDYFNSGWATCLFAATEGGSAFRMPAAGYGQALDAVSGALAASALAKKPQLIGPETSGIGNNSLQRYLASVNLDEVAGIAHHLYNGGEGGDDPAPDSFADAMTGVAAAVAGDSKPLWMTEFSPNVPSMLNTAWLIHDELVTEGVAAYVYWDLIWPPPSAGASPAGLVTIPSNSPSSPYTINDTYYALKHFARWTDPGWVRVDAAATVDAVKVSAFQSPDGTGLTVVLINTDTVQHVVSLNAGGFAFGTAAAYRSSGPAERVATLALGDEQSVGMPAQSIATVVMTP
jgi:glucuronoarabinoxylan endo-1,4-beta-xylanase